VNPPALPRGWAPATLGEILPLSYGKSLPASRRTAAGTVPVYGSSGIIGRHEEAMVQGPTIVVGRKGSVGDVYHEPGPCWPIDTVYFTHGHPELDLLFCSYLLRSANLGSLDRSTAVPGLSRDDYNRMRVPVPPLLEQHRIVAAIEERLSGLVASVATLEGVRAQLPRYRAAVLKAACEGCLAARGPKDWTQTTLGDVATDISYGTSAKTTAEPGVPVLRMGNIVDGQLSFNKLKYLPSSHHEFPSLLLAPGDILFNRTNSAELVGKTAVYSGSPTPCSFASYLIRVRVSDGCEPRYLSAYLNSVLGRTWIASVASQQVGQANVSGGKLRSMPIRLPPFAEQRRIVNEIEWRLSLVGALRLAVDAAIMRATRLRQAILKSAFQGELVPQDPSDEPAGTLLARVRAGAARPKSRDCRTGGVTP